MLFMIRRLRTSFYEDWLLTTTTIAGFRNNEHFMNVRLAAKATGWFGRLTVRWRIHTLRWAADYPAAVHGDFVECGVVHGETCPW